MKRYRLIDGRLTVHRDGEWVRVVHAESLERELRRLSAIVSDEDAEIIELVIQDGDA